MSLHQYRTYFNNINLNDLSGDFKHSASVSVIILEKNSDHELIFIQRQKNPNDPWSGHIAFPGGKKSPVDQEFIDVALRETYEEIGIQLKHSQLIGRLNDLQGRKSGHLQNFFIRPYLFFLSASDATNLNFQLNQNEVQNILTVSMQKLFSQESSSQIQVSYQNRQLLLPAIQIEEYQIWGLTYLILHELQQHLNPLHILRSSYVLPAYPKPE